MRNHRNKTRKRTVKVPPAIAEQSVNLLQLLVEAGGARKTRRRRKILKRR
jgi:hypothetical protein